jgi:hypothetical protein
LREGIASGRRFGIGARPRLFEFGACLVEILLIGRQLTHRGFGVTAVRYDFAQQGITMANEIAEGVEPLQDG